MSQAMFKVAEINPAKSNDVLLSEVGLETFGYGLEQRTAMHINGMTLFVYEKLQGIDAPLGKTPACSTACTPPDGRMLALLRRLQDKRRVGRMTGPHRA